MHISMVKWLILLILRFKALIAPPQSASPNTAMDPLLNLKSNSEATMSFKPRFTDNELLKQRISRNELSPTQLDNLDMLQARTTVLFQAYLKPLIATSGYRPPNLNASIGGAARSWHCECAAVDVADPNGEIWAFCLENLRLCADLGLWLEDKRWTPTWIHLQVYPPNSGARIFKPNKKAPADAKAWNGEYDKRLDSIKR